MKSGTMMTTVVADVGLPPATRTAILSSARARRTGHRIAKSMLVKMEAEREAEIAGHLARLAEIEVGMARLMGWLDRDAQRVTATKVRCR